MTKHNTAPPPPWVLHLVRDVLDKQLVSTSHDPLGKADGLLIDVTGGRPPRVVAIESGAAALARRIHPRLEDIARAISRRLGVRRGRSHFFRWPAVRSVSHAEIELAGDADRCPSTAWERWLGEHFTAHVPGSGNFGSRS